MTLDLVSAQFRVFGDPKDPLKHWLSLRDHLCIPTSKEAQEFVTKIGDYLYSQLDRYDLRQVNRTANGADVWIVAWAAADRRAVVTNEKPEPRTKKPKIADICKIFDVIRAAQWSGRL